MNQERPYRVHKKILLVIALSIAAALTGKMFWDHYKFSQLDEDAQFKTYLQEFYNEVFDYTSIDGDTNKLRDIISKTHIELHGDIEDIKIAKLRERIFELIWTHHAGGFSNYMKLRKPEGIEYNLYTNSWNYYYFTTNSPPQMRNEIDYMKRSVSRENNFTNLISELCLDYDELQKGRHISSYFNLFNSNALLGVHIIRTNSLADPRFCEDVLDFRGESECWPFTSTNMTSRFLLLTNAVGSMMGFNTPTPRYTTPETPRQELETTGEITLAYACFAFKCIHHGNRGAPFVAQWHWDKALSRWITDYFCNGNDYRNPISRYYTEPSISTIF